MEQDKIIQYITNQIDNPSEKETIRNWINSSEKNKKAYSQIKNVYALSRISNRKTDLDQEYLRFQNAAGLKRKRYILEIIKYAAIVVVTVGLSVFVQDKYRTASNDSVELTNELYSPAGQISELLLSDGTKVWLNAGSKLTYPSNFSSKNRIVQLNGEAFFKVASDEKNPFIVETSKMKVKVLGTSFNIDAFDSNNYTETTLVEGKVEILTNEDAKITEMFPGQLAKFDGNVRKIEVSDVDTRFYSTWKDGKMTFFNEPLEGIVQKLERWYNVDFTFANEEIKTYRFSGTILKYKPLDQVLQIMKHSSPIDYSTEMNFQDKNEIILKKLDSKAVK